MDGSLAGIPLFSRSIFALRAATLRRGLAAALGNGRRTQIDEGNGSVSPIQNMSLRQ